MTSGLDKACALLDAFEKEIDNIGIFYKQPGVDNPPSWQEQYYRIWLHGATDIWECHELERWLTDYPPGYVLPALVFAFLKLWK